MDNILQADYEVLEQVAKSWKALYDRISTLHGALKSQSEELCTQHWLGKGSDTFYAEMSDTVLPTVQRTADAFEIASSLTTEIAATLHESEDRCATMFR